MLISEDALFQIIDDTWNSTLGLPVERQVGLKLGATPELEVCVKIMGAWEGELGLQCPLPLARRIAGAIFEGKGEDDREEDVLDALSELVHIIGGNLKALLPHPVTLSLPCAPDPDQAAQAEPEAEAVSSLLLTCEGYLFVVRLCGRAVAVAEEPSI